MDMIMKKDSKSSQRIINKKQVRSSRQELQNTAPRRKSQNILSRQKSETIVPRRELQNTSSRRKSEVTAPHQESVVSRRESQNTLSRQKLETIAPRRESQNTLSRRKSEVTESRQESAETVFIIDMDQFKNMQTFLDVINEKIDLTNGANKLYTLSGELIQSMDEIDDDKEYVAAANIFTPLLYGQTKFITSDTEMLNKDSEPKDSEPESTKLMSLRISRSVDSKKDKCMPEKESKSSAPTETKLSVENISPKNKKTKAKSVAKKNSVAANTVSNLSQFKKTVAKFTSSSSTPSSSLAARNRSKTPKLTVRMDPTTLPKYPLLSAGQRPSTISIKNRTPTPKPGAKIHQYSSNNHNTNNTGDKTGENMIIPKFFQY
ncbi:hypothetical protein DINM_004594 [Dirofilaria immitis]|nr:hypothetical protein [Dirofilaria immitis]